MQQRHTQFGAGDSEQPASSTVVRLQHEIAAPGSVICQGARRPIGRPALDFISLVEEC